MGRGLSDYGEHSGRPEKMTMEHRRAVTLVELMVVMVVVLGAVFGLVYVLSEAGRTTWLFTDAQMESSTDAQRALDRMAEDLRVAQAAQVRCLNAGAGPLEMGQDETAAEIVYVFDAATGSLLRTQATANPAVVTVGSKLTAFTCTDPDANQVVTLTVTSRGGLPNGRTDSQTLRTNVWIQLP